MGTSGGFSSLYFLEFLDLCNFRAFMEFLELCCISIYYYYYLFIFLFNLSKQNCTTSTYSSAPYNPTMFILVKHQYQNLKLLEIVPTIDIKHRTHKHPPAEMATKSGPVVGLSHIEQKK